MLRKMKDLRGVHAAAVKNAIFKEFGLQALPGKKRASDILEWKKLNKVKESYLKLYDNDGSVMENIAKLAFPSISEEDGSFNNIYTYTAAVCDIVLNPDYPDIECAKKPLERRFKKFKVFVKAFFFVIYYNLLKFIQNY
jgi:hypothetical protein